MKKQERHSYLFTNNKETCTGCRACESICKHNAISFYEDKEGFLYPKVSLQDCIDCGLCDIKCPHVDNLIPQENDSVKYYAVWSKKENYQLTQDCATMGLSSIIANYVLRNDGVVYGVVLDTLTQSSKHVRITSLAEQHQMRNSKYMQSDVNMTYREAKQDLESNKIVYYTGTPCQIAGLKSYLNKEYSNLYTTDLICHGVFSHKIFKAELAYWKTKLKGDIRNFKFRGKGKFPYSIGGLVNFDLHKNGKVKHIDIPAKFSPMYYCYAYSNDGFNYVHRLSCYNCKYRTTQRVGDISIGDFHGRGKYHSNDLTLEMEKYGMAVVFINTPNGEDIFERIKDEICFFQTTEKAIAVQPALLGLQREIPIKRHIIYDNLDKLPIDELVRQYIFSDEYANRRKMYTSKYLQKMKIVHFLWRHPKLKQILQNIKKRI